MPLEPLEPLEPLAPLAWPFVAGTESGVGHIFAANCGERIEGRSVVVVAWVLNRKKKNLLENSFFYVFSDSFSLRHVKARQQSFTPQLHIHFRSDSPPLPFQYQGFQVQ